VKFLSLIRCTEYNSITAVWYVLWVLWLVMYIQTMVRLELYDAQASGSVSVWDDGCGV